MRPITVFSLGLVGGLATYAVCSAVFWYGMVVIPAYLLLGLTLVGIVSLVVAGVSALALIIGLILMVADKLESRGKAH